MVQERLDHTDVRSHLDVYSHVAEGLHIVAACVAIIFATVCSSLAIVVDVAMIGRLTRFPIVLLLSIELFAVVALVAISAWQPEIHGRHIRRLAVVLWGTTAFGVIHAIAEYMIMIRFSDANWDDPPGTGYLTAATITISAIVTAIMTLCAPQRGADEPHRDHHSGLLAHA